MACAVLAAGVVAAPAAAPDAVPDVPLVDLGGRPIDLRQARATELIFVAAWCEPCGRALTAARRRAGALRRQGYRTVVVGVGTRESADAFARWARGYGFGDALVFDRDGRIEAAFGAEYLPWHVVIAGGRVVHRGDRAPGLEELRRWLAGG